MKNILKALGLILVLAISVSGCSNDSKKEDASRINGSYRQFFYSTNKGQDIFVYVWNGNDKKPTLVAKNKRLVQATKKYVILLNRQKGTYEVGNEVYYVVDRPSFKKVYEGKDLTSYIDNKCIEDCELDLEISSFSLLQRESLYPDTFISKYFPNEIVENESVEDYFVNGNKIYELKSKLVAQGEECEYSVRSFSSEEPYDPTENKTLGTFASYSSDGDDESDDNFNDLAFCDMKFGRSYDEYVVNTWKGEAKGESFIYNAKMKKIATLGPKLHDWIAG